METSRHERAKAALLVLILGGLLGIILAVPASYLVEPRRSWTSWGEVNGFLEREYDPRLDRDKLVWSIPTVDDFIVDTD
jgi:hypothetical protein